MNCYGIASGVILFIIIAVWHKIVVLGHYHFGKKICAVSFAIVGVMCVVASLIVDSIFLSVVFAMFGFSALWGVKEAFEQEKRVQNGWYPSKNKKHPS